MLTSQRDAFDIPGDVCYLNAAAWSPLPHAVQDAGLAGVRRKGRPWELGADFAEAQHARARTAAAAVIGADPADIALIPSISYGFATAGKLLPVPQGSRVLVLEDDHSSPVLEWMQRGHDVDTVRRPGDGDWTAAVLDAIARPGAPPVAVASLSTVHWADGGIVDLERVAPALRACGAALAVDATHGAGVLPCDLRVVDPDVLVFPTYKWLLGPYGRAFLYVAPRRQDGVPLEQAGHARRAVASDRSPYLADIGFVTGARRFDMGERDHLISLEMAAVGMEMMAGWGCAAITARLRTLTARLAAGLRDIDVPMPDAALRAPHILSLDLPGATAATLTTRLRADNVHVAPRLGHMRISPHVYNDEADVDRFVAAFAPLWRAAS